MCKNTEQALREASALAKAQAGLTVSNGVLHHDDFAKHETWGTVKVKWFPETGWYYLRRGYAGRGVDFEVVSACAQYET